MSAGSCDMGVGCDETGVCYAYAHGEPERCPREAAKKYLLMPGWVVSLNDHDTHYLDAWQLAALYKVPMAECVIVTKAYTQEVDRSRYHATPLIPLVPRWDGNYTIPTETV